MTLRRTDIKLYVGNLVYNMTESELNDLFSACGTVVTVRIITDHFTRQSKNFGYVEMSSPGDGQEAIEQLNGKLVHDRSLVVKKARSRSERRGLGW
jgi:RNA recognition motif-containing protein